MTRPQHKVLMGGSWGKLSFFQQMANLGSEVERLIKWRQKKQSKLSHKALLRALELLDATIENQRHTPTRTRELLRVKECLLDSFLATNEYKSRDQDWQSYFRAFNMAASIEAGR